MIRKNIGSYEDIVRKFEAHNDKLAVDKFWLLRGEVTSSKNSKRIIKPKGRTESIIISSKATLAYKAKHSFQYKNEEARLAFRAHTEGKLSYVGFYFIRETHRTYDYNNMTQLICDMLVEYDWLDDDNRSMLVPVILGEYVLEKPYKKLTSGTFTTNSGVILTILKDEYQSVSIQAGQAASKCFFPNGRI